MKNFPIIDKETGREYWISRSVAVLVALYAKDKDNQDNVLVVQRGIGTPDSEFVGKYCMPCGYLDYDETCREAAARELKEETGLTIPMSDFKFVNYNDNPNEDKRQNITFRFVVKSLVPKEDLEKLFTTKNSEKDEVSSIRFIRVNDVEMYDWAFNHKKLCQRLNVL